MSFQGRLQSAKYMTFVDKKNHARDVYEFKRTFSLWGRGVDDLSHILDENFDTIRVEMVFLLVLLLQKPKC